MGEYGLLAGSALYTCLLLSQNRARSATPRIPLWTAQNIAAGPWEKTAAIAPRIKNAIPAHLLINLRLQSPTVYFLTWKLQRMTSRLFTHLRVALSKNLSLNLPRLSYALTRKRIHSAECIPKGASSLKTAVS